MSDSCGAFACDLLSNFLLLDGDFLLLKMLFVELFDDLVLFKAKRIVCLFLKALLQIQHFDNLAQMLRVLREGLLEVIVGVLHLLLERFEQGHMLLFLAT